MKSRRIPLGSDCRIESSGFYTYMSNTEIQLLKKKSAKLEVKEGHEIVFVDS